MTIDSFRRAALAAAASLTMAAVPAAAETFNASIWFPDSHPLTRFGYLDWAKSLEAATGGRLTPKVFTGTALLSPAEHLNGVRKRGDVVRKCVHLFGERSEPRELAGRGVVR